MWYTGNSINRKQPTRGKGHREGRGGGGVCFSHLGQSNKQDCMVMRVQYVGQQHVHFGVVRSAYWRKAARVT